MNSRTHATSWIRVRDASTGPSVQLDNELKTDGTGFLKDMAIALVIAAALFGAVAAALVSSFQI
jgi:hypothetical protein